MKVTDDDTTCHGCKNDLLQEHIGEAEYKAHIEGRCRGVPECGYCMEANMTDDELYTLIVNEEPTIHEMMRFLEVEGARDLYRRAIVFAYRLGRVDAAEEELQRRAG